MTNRYFSNTIDLIGGTKARASDVEANFTQVGNGFDGVQAEMDAKAPLASPVLTGVPTAPTADLGTSSTQLATTAFVASQAFASSLPGQAGNAGKHLITNGTAASWQTIAATWGNISGQPTTLLGYTGQTAAAARTELGGLATLAGTETLTNKTMNGANNTFSNMPTSALTGAVTIANGGSGATTAAGARTNLGVPSTSGSGATGTWTINIIGVATSADVSNACAGNSVTASKAGSLGSGGTGGGTMFFTYNGTAGTPMWLWGSNTADGSNSSVFNPANFSVSHATTSGNAGTVSSITSAQVGGAIAGGGVFDIGSHVFAKNFSGVTVGPGGFIAGSSLVPSDSGDHTGGGGVMSGTWRMHGWCDIAFTSLWVRVA